jgi:hypothetical protein
MNAYTTPWINGQQAVDRIIEATGCGDVDAWRAFIAAAADGAFQVRKFAGVHGVTPPPANEVELFEPNAVPLGYWLRAMVVDDLYIMSDWSRYRVLRAAFSQSAQESRTAIYGRTPFKNLVERFAGRRKNGVEGVWH